MTQFVSIQPVLPAKNVSEAIDFYVNKLGFVCVFQDSADDPKYAGVRRDNIELHLQWHDEKHFENAERPALRFVVQDVDKLFEEYKNKDFFGIDDSPQETSWGTYEFSFFDLNRNGLFFYRDL